MMGSVRLSGHVHVRGVDASINSSGRRKEGRKTTNSAVLTGILLDMACFVPL
jgi:hypothetical protein